MFSPFVMRLRSQHRQKLVYMTVTSASQFASLFCDCYLTPGLYRSILANPNVKSSNRPSTGTSKIKGNVSTMRRHVARDETLTHWEYYEQRCKEENIRIHEASIPDEIQEMRDAKEAGVDLWLVLCLSCSVQKEYTYIVSLVTKAIVRLR